MPAQLSWVPCCSKDNFYRRTRALAAMNRRQEKPSLSEKRGGGSLGDSAVFLCSARIKSMMMRGYSILFPAWVVALVKEEGS
jgi:hypothetical protein